MSTQQQQPTSNGEQENKKTFVPWLGEAKPKRGPIYDFEAKLGSKFQVEYMNGRIVEGTLVSYDRFCNLVLEDAVMHSEDGSTRELGKVFSRGRVESMGSQ